MAEQTSPAYADARQRYRLDARIASGGMGQVWRATDTVLDRPVAVKQLLREHADDPVFRSRFETEAQHAASLHHPGVAQVYDFGAGDDARPPYLVMELVDGRPLSALLRGGEPMDVEAAAELVAAVGDALGAAHAKGIVHRDVKPANILVTDDRRVKITDFGIARAADAVALTRTGEVLGTPQYVSPEQAEGKVATPASDVYSLAAVAFECLTGRRPYDAESPVATALAHLREPVPELPSDVPPALAAVVRRGLAKAPSERYADGAAFAAAVRAALTPEAAEVAAGVAEPAPPTLAMTTGVPAAAPVAPAAASRRSRARRVPVPVWAAVGAFVVVVAVAAIAGLTTAGDGSPANGPGGRTPHTRPGSSGPTVASTPVASSHSTPPTPPPGPTKAGKPPKKKPLDHHDHHDKGQGHQHGKGHQ